jgi:predicted membrane protein
MGSQFQSLAAAADDRRVTRRLLSLAIMLAPILLALAFIYDVGGVRTAFANHMANSVTHSLPSPTPTAHRS